MNLSLKIEINAYRIKREFRGRVLKAEAEFFIDNRSSAVGIKEVNKEILKVLKIDYKNFNNSFFASQKEVASLLKLNQKEREISIRKMIGLEKLDKLDDRVKGAVKDLNERIKIKKESLLTEDEKYNLENAQKENEQKLKVENEKCGKAKAKVEVASKEYEALKWKLKQSDELKNEFDKVNNKINIENEKIKNNLRQIGKVENEIEELNRMIERLKELEPKKKRFLEKDKRYEELLKLKSKLERKIASKKKIEDCEKDLAELKNEQDKLNKEIDKLKNVEQKIEALQKHINASEGLIKTESEKRDLINEIISKAKGKIEQSAARLESIKNIGKMSNCPECERPLKEHYDKLIKKYEDELTENETTVSDKKILLEQSDKKIENLGKERADYKREFHKLEGEIENRRNLQIRINETAKKISYKNKIVEAEVKEYEELADIKFEEKELKDVSAEKEILKPEFDEYNKTKTKSEELPKKETDLNSLKAEEDTLRVSLNELKTVLENIKFDSDKHAALKEQRERAEDELNQLKEILHKIEKTLEVIKNKIKEDTNALRTNEEMLKEIENLNKKQNLYDRLRNLVVEFKSKITSRELPAISREASKLFSKITMNRYYNLKIDTEFNFKVSREDKEVELESLSGGEKDLASLCLRVAISKRISALMGRANMGFLALDEVFGSQDEERREELMNALGKISVEFKQIFVVSHNQDVQEQFPNLLLINKKNGYSQAEIRC